jgi:ketosteroid isomerase-like protein
VTPVELTEERLAELIASIDARDADRFVGFLAHDARFRFGNAPSVIGRPAIRAAVAGFFRSIAACKHHIERIWRGPDTIAIQGEVAYTRLDGGKISIPFANVFVLHDGLIVDYSIYVDVSPLFA